MKKTAILSILMIFFWGCATFTQNYKLGNKAEVNKNWDEAISYYERASLEKPYEPVYRLALIRARQSAGIFHLHEARKLAAGGDKEGAKKAYSKALSYDPLNRMIVEEAKLLDRVEVKKETPEKKSLEYPVKLKVPKEKMDLKFPNEAGLRQIFLALGKHAGVSILFDEAFRDVSLMIDLSGKEFEEALQALCLASRNFYRIIDERMVIIIPDRPEKRQQYDLSVIRTFYLSNINAQDMQNSLVMMLRSQFRVPFIITDKNLNSITIRDVPANIELAEKLLRSWDKPKAEVVINLEIMEVSRIKLRKLGIEFDQNIIGLRYGGSVGSGKDGWFNLKDLDFSKAENFQLTLPTSLLQFLESDADTKIIAQPWLRGLSEEEIRYLVGQKIPITRTTFNPIAAGGVSMQPVVGFEQQDVGIDVKIKPKVHFEKEITLELEIKITSIAGVGVADIPIISTREVKNVIRLKDGETNLLAGLLRDEERRSLKGIAGLKNIPILGNLFSVEDKVVEQTDVILTITPYIVRSLPISEEDVTPLWVDLEGIRSSARPSDLIMPIDELMTERIFRPGERVPPAVREEEEENLINLSPTSFEIPKEREFRMSLNVICGQEVSSLSLNLSFNPQIMKLKDVIEGGVIRQMGEKVPFLKNIDNAGGSCTVGVTTPQMGKGFRGAGNLAVLVFEAVNAGESQVVLSRVVANGPDGRAVNFSVQDSRVIVR